MIGAGRAALLTAGALALGGCTPGILGDIDRLEGEAWVDVHEDPTSPGFAEYGRDIAFGGAAGEAALRLFVLGEFPDAGAVPVDYAGDGERAFPEAVFPSDVEEQPAESDPPLPLAGDPAEQTVGLGYRTGSGQIRVAIIDASAAVSRGDVVLPSPGFPRALAFGEGVGNEERDLVVGAGAAGADPELLYMPDFTPNGSSPPLGCTLAAEPTAILFPDLDDDGAGRVFVASSDDVEIYTFGDIMSSSDGTCVPGAALGAGGQALAVGDVDDSGAPDLLVGRPAENTVDVYLDIDPTAPELTEPPITGPNGSERFGAALAVGDFDQDGVADLAVGDPGAEADGKPGGGLVHLYLGGSDFPEAPVEPPLRDNEPSDDQAFGRALEVGAFAGMADVLAVGARGEVFTYFRLFQGAEDPRSSP